VLSLKVKMATHATETFDHVVRGFSHWSLLQRRAVFGRVDGFGDTETMPFRSGERAINVFHDPLKVPAMAYEMRCVVLVGRC
jgi:hypothetical protein